jgi:hypothetical protein
MATDIVTSSQICVKETKNLGAEQQTTDVLRRNESSSAIGKIVEYEFWMLKQGYAKSTIECRVKIMKRLTKLGACLYDPESIKEITAKQYPSYPQNKKLTNSSPDAEKNQPRCFNH